MKPCLSILAFILLAGLPGRAQIAISVDPPQQLADTTDVDFSDPWWDWGPHSVYIHNTGDTLIDLQWIVITPEDCPNDWGVRPNDEQQSFPTTITTNYDPPLIDQTVPLPVGDSTYFYLLHLPYGKPGCCTYTIEFRDVNNPDIELPPATIELRVNDSNCLVTSTSRMLETPLQVFPNPAGNWLYFSPPINRNTHISIYNSRGQLVGTHPEKTDRIDVAELPRGLYFVKATIKNGNHRTLPFVKG